MICWTRWTWLAKQATTMRRRAAAKMSSRARPTSTSETMKPGWSALVESDRSRSIPSAASRARPPRSVGRWSIGVRSSFQSPVCTIVPAGVRRATATPSGMECDMA
jgi:hypothetical protein